MTPKTRLGGFELEEPISSGGMGTVWRAVHVVTSRPVAVKVIAAENARNPFYVEGFEREVRAVARMAHPRITRVYDFGRVDPEAARRSDGALPVGAPWLAMELATRGSLSSLPGVGDWNTLKTILFDILDALAHSHARQVIHRDLKPGNVLLVETDEGIRCQLTDFGIAHASGSQLTTREVFASSAGTPWYMAPEQVESRWRDYGPWTDLYALGCVAYELASGRTPFVGKSAVRVARQQLFSPPPLLDPIIDVPPGFEAWVRQLLVKEIEYRFRRAADAAWALERISPRNAEPLTVPSAVVENADAPTTPLGFEATPFQTTDLLTGEAVETETYLSVPEGAPPPPAPPTTPAYEISAALTEFGRPPFPETWETPADRRSGTLLGSGLGLYRLREPPMVGRREERDALWQCLGEVAVGGEPRAVVIRGEPGAGKSRLAHWLAERAHELGAVTQMWATHDPAPGKFTGIPPMLDRYLGCTGLDIERCYDRVRRLLTLYSNAGPDVVQPFAAAVAHILHPTEESPEVPAVHFTTPDERREPMVQIIRRVAHRRPTVVIIDDAQWGFEAVELTRSLLAVDAPVLILLTVRDALLVERPLERNALRELEEHPLARALELGPIETEDHLELMDQMLVLEPALRQAVLHRTLGQPLFAAELIGGWVKRGLLQSGPQGFRLAPGIEIPDSLDQLWNDRLDRALSALDDPLSARKALEIGAAQGMRVMRRDFIRACKALGIWAPDHLGEVLVDSGFIEGSEDGGWSLTHQLLRESILARAKREGRAAEQHRVLAEMLEFREDADSQFRRALHLIELGQHEPSIVALLAAATAMMRAGRLQESHALQAMIDEQLEHLDDGHPLRAKAIELRLALFRIFKSPGETAAYAESVRPIVEANRWDGTHALLLRALAHRAMHLADVKLAGELLQQAIAKAHAGRRPIAIASAHHAQGIFELRQGHIDDSEAHFRVARDHYAMENDPEGESVAITGLAEIERARGNFPRARQLNLEAIGLARAHGQRWILVNHLVLLGEVSMSEENFTEAEQVFGEAHSLAAITNHTTLPVAAINLALAKMNLPDRAKVEEAIVLLDSARTRLEPQGHRLYLFFTRIARCWCMAFLDDRVEWDAMIDSVLDDATEDMALREAAEQSLRAADRWLALGSPRRAAQAVELADKLVPQGHRNDLEPKIESSRERIQRAPVEPH